MDMNRRLMGNIERMPLVVKQGMGATITQAAGEPLLDFWGDEGVCSMGMNTPEFLQAIHSFLATGNPHRLPDVYPHQTRWDAAEIICDRTGMDRVFFANSGTEANEAAIKIARKFWWDKERGYTRNLNVPFDMIAPRRHVILTINGNFHGRTGFAMAASDPRVSPYHRHGFGPIPKGFGVLDDKTFWQVVTDGVEHEGKEPEWDAVAAIILAPVLGNNLVKTYPAEFWEHLDSIRSKNGVLLIYDDVQAGNGRAGHFASWQGCGVKPDIMTLSKGIAMGLPMSCMLARDEIARAFTPGVHFNTFGGTLLCCHLAIKLYQWLDANIHLVRNKGEFIRQTWSSMPWIKEFDGAGLLNAFTPDYEAGGYDGFQFITEGRNHGLSLVTHRQFGPIRFTPPLNVSHSDIQMALWALDETHKALKEAR